GDAVKRILVLGGGLVGSAIARNLSRDGDLEVTVADNSSQVCDTLTEKYGLTTTQLDVTHKRALTQLVRKTDLVVGAVPGFVGYQVLKTVIKAETAIVDISFFPEDPLALHDLAVKNNVTAVIDAGLAPGLSNLVIGRYHEEYDPLDSFVCYVGGLPKVRKWPFEYHAVFSPADVLEEYTRPVLMKVGGQLVTRSALTDLELIDLPRIGTLEAFNTNGLRTLLATMRVPDMQEKTLRYPGHADRMRMLREVGFFDREHLDIGGEKVRPIDVTSRLLFNAWQSTEDGRDVAVMRICLSGSLQGRHIKTVVDLYDEYDEQTHTTAMARTTGYTCAAVVRLILDGAYRQPGIRPLEYLGADKAVYRRLLGDLADWGIALNVQQVAES
ncbi:MAG: saccharopine dehydrogenase NADP-binding domain-containing protein, partial [Fidelibacterota bacterium]